MIKKTVRDQSYSLNDYLGYVKEGDICDNADVQRLAGSFDNREINELVYTALTQDHIPELILAECNEDNHTYITDGLQRTTMLTLFKYGNYKISSAIDNPIVEYMSKKRDENGNIVRNERGQIKLEEVSFNIIGKTFETLPEELQKAFNDFQIRIVIHEDCTMKRISELIKRYNCQRAMTASQKAFTYMNVYAVAARGISNKKFFVECSGYKEKEKINGTIERVVTESIMCVYHLDDWKKTPKAVCEYLNNNSSDEEFKEFNKLVDRLGDIVNADFNKVFTSKNSFIWFNIFSKFIKYGIDDYRFADFIKEFNNTLHSKIVEEVTYKDMDNITYDKLDKEAGTKDKVLVSAKINTLEKLLMDYLHISIEESDLLDGIEQEDIDFYEDMLSDLTLSVDNSSKLLDKHNHESMIKLMEYCCKKDIDPDNWFINYFNRNSDYIKSQKQNYEKMCADLLTYIGKNELEISFLDDGCGINKRKEKVNGEISS